ncbi:RhoGAP domain protein [Cooperia oncophora]
MNLEHGRDYFIPVMAQYYPRVFGVSLEHLLTKKKDTVVGNLIDFVYRLVCALQLLAPKMDLNDVANNSTFIIVRNALEHDFPKDLTELQVPPVALYSALMRLIDTLKEPLIPASQLREIRVASNDPTALWKIISSLPPVNASLLEYILDYLRELIAQFPSAATDQLVAWADVLFRGGALLTTVPHLEPRVVALRSLCAYRKDVAIFGIS